jgi:hypothetical protein
MDHHSVMGSWLFGEAVHDLLWISFTDGFTDIHKK